MKGVLRRVVNKACRLYKAWKAQSAEEKVLLPQVIIVVGSEYSGADLVVDYLREHGSGTIYDEIFLQGLHEWFPSMNHQTDSILRNCCGQSAVYHVRLLTRELLNLHKGLIVLRINTSHETAQYPRVLDTVSLLFPNAIFLHVIRNPITEFAEHCSYEQGVSAQEFSLRWREAVRGWLQFARSNPVSYYIISRDVALSTSKMDFRDHLLLKVEYKPSQTVLRWQSLKEIGNQLAALVKLVGLEGSSQDEFRFSLPTDELSRISENDHRHILKNCVWEMRILRQVSVGSSIRLTGEEWPEDRRSERLKPNPKFENEEPIFVIGSGRSGTTYLATTLGLHPNIAHFPKETKFFPAFFRWMESLSIEAAHAEEIGRKFIYSWLMAYRDATHKPRLLEKTPSNIFVINWLWRCFPKAKFIHIYRDPRDVVASLEKEISKPSIEIGAQRWLEHVGLALQKGSHIGQTQFLNVSYEQLVRDPIQTFTDICSFLKEESYPILEYVRQRTSSHAVGRWKTSLTTEQVAVVEKICGKLMLELGYEISRT